MAPGGIRAMRFHELLLLCPPQKEIVSWDDFAKEFKRALDAKREELETIAQNTNCGLNFKGEFIVTLESGLQVKPTENGDYQPKDPIDKIKPTENRDNQPEKIKWEPVSGIAKRKWGDQLSAFNDIKAAYFQMVGLEKAVAELPDALKKFREECREKLGGVLDPAKVGGGAEALDSAVRFYEEEKSRLPVEVQQRFLEAELRIRLADFEQSDEEKPREAFKAFQVRLGAGKKNEEATENATEQPREKTLEEKLLEESQRKFASAENRKEFQRRLQSIRNGTDLETIDQLKKVVEGLVRGNPNDLPKDALDQVQQAYDRACQNLPPGIPRKPNVSTENYDLITIAWEKVPRAVDYLIFRSESPAGDNRSQVGGEVNAPKTLAEDDKAEPEKDYYYWVIARNNNGERTSESPAKGRRPRLDPLKAAEAAAQKGDVSTVVKIYLDPTNLGMADDLFAWLQKAATKCLAESKGKLKNRIEDDDIEDLNAKHQDVKADLTLVSNKVQKEGNEERIEEVKDLIGRNRKILEQIKKYRPPLDGAEIKYAAAIDSGSAAMAAGKFAEAIQYFNEALAVKPEDAEAKRLKQTAEGERNYQVAIVAAEAAERAGRFEEVIKQADVALQARPGEAKAVALKGRAENEWKYQSALAAGRAALNEGNLDGAIGQFDAALAVKPEDHEAWKLKAEAGEKQSRKQRYNLAVTAGLAAFQAGNFSEAVKQAELALAVWPEEPQARKLKEQAESELRYTAALGLGDTALAEQKFSEATGHFDAALAIKPGDPTAQKRKAAAAALQAQQTVREPAFQAAMKAAQVALDDFKAVKADLRISQEGLQAHLAGIRQVAEWVLEVRPGDASAKALKQRAEDEQKYAAEMAAGGDAIQDGKFAEALGHFDAALAIKPNDSAALNQKQAAQDRENDAAKEFKRQAESEQQQAFASAMTEGEQAFAANQFGEAIRHFDKALSIKPNEPAALKRKQAAEDWLKVERANEQKLACERSKALGRKALAVGELAQAVSHFTEALQADPKDTEAQNLKESAEHEQKYLLAKQAGEAALAIRDFKEAMHQAERALNFKKNDAAAGKLKQDAENEIKYADALVQGEAAITAGKYAEAAGYFDESLRLKPNDTVAQARKGFAQTEQKFHEAIAAGQVALESKKFEETIRQANLALAIKPENEAALNLRRKAENFISEGSYAKAVALGEAAITARKFAEAIGHFEAALRLKPNDANAQARKGFAQTEQKFHEAMAEGQRALKSKEYDRAIRQAEQALNLKNNDADAAKLKQEAENEIKYADVLALGEAAIKAGKFAEAAGHFNEALKFKPSDTDAKVRKEYAEREQNYDLALQRCRKEWADRNWDQVIQAADLAQRLKPQDPEVLELRRKAASEKEFESAVVAAGKAAAANKYAEAIQFFDQALAIKRDDAEVQKRKKAAERDLAYASAQAAGNAAFKAGDFILAYQQAERALKARPGDDDAQKLKKDAETEQVFKMAMAAADAAFSKKDYPEAIKQADIALAAKPGNQRASQLRAQAAKDFDFETMVGHQFKISMAEGRKALAKADFDGAIAHFKLALEAKPNDPEAQDLLHEAQCGQDYKSAMAQARAMMQTGNYAESIKQANLALQARPGDSAAEVLKQLAEVEYQYVSAMEAGTKAMSFFLYRRAIRHFEKALAVKPGNLVARTLKEKAERLKRVQDIILVLVAIMLVAIYFLNHLRRAHDEKQKMEEKQAIAQAADRAAKGDVEAIELLEKTYPDEKSYLDTYLAQAQEVKRANDERQAIAAAPALAEKGDVQGIQLLEGLYPDQKSFLEPYLVKAGEKKRANDEQQAIAQAKALAESGDAQAIEQLEKTYPDQTSYLAPFLDRAKQVIAAKKTQPVPPPDADAVAKAKAMAAVENFAGSANVQGIKDLEANHPAWVNELNKWEKAATDLADDQVRQALLAADAANVAYIEEVMSKYPALIERLQKVDEQAKAVKSNALTQAKNYAEQGDLPRLIQWESGYPILAEEFKPINAAAKIPEAVPTWAAQGNVAEINSILAKYPFLQAGLQTYLDEANKVVNDVLTKADNLANAAKVEDLNDLLSSYSHIAGLAEKIKVAENKRDMIVKQADADAENGDVEKVDQLQIKYRAVDLSKQKAKAQENSRSKVTGPKLPANFGPGTRYANGYSMNFVYVPQNGAWPGGFIGLSEVTKDQYAVVEGRQPLGSGGGGDLPKTGLPPQTAAIFCKSLTDQETTIAGNLPAGWTYRLPSARELEALKNLIPNPLVPSPGFKAIVFNDFQYDTTHQYYLYKSEFPSWQYATPLVENADSGYDACFKVVLVKNQP
jgi:tetratricopeptide (TPR) repeat protein